MIVVVRWLSLPAPTHPAGRRHARAAQKRVGAVQVSTLDRYDEARLAQAAAKLQGEWGRLVLTPFILFAAHTGLRPGELYALRWQDINLTGNTVAVEWQWSQTERRLVRPKYDSTRRVFLPPAAKDALDATARVRDEVFSAPRGGRLSGTVMGHYWPPVARSVGRPDLTPPGSGTTTGRYSPGRGSPRTRSRR